MIRAWLLDADHRLAMVGRRLSRRLGSRGAFLGSIANFDLVWAWTLVDPTAARAAAAAPTYGVIVRMGATISAAHPLWPWAALMGAVGLLCGIQAWRDDDRTAFAAAIFIKVVWIVATLATFKVAGTQVIRPVLIFATIGSFVIIAAAGLPYRTD